MNFKQVLTITASSILASAMATSTAMAANKKAERWFEMEVILFSQLDDKSKLKEAFPEQIPLPKYKKVWDLLTPYLNPDIATLKQQLPGCDNPKFDKNMLEQQVDALAPFYQPKSLEALEALSKQQYKNYFNPYAVTPPPVETPAEQDSNIVKNTELATGIESPEVEVFEPTLSAEQVALVNLAEQTFTATPLKQIENATKTELCYQDKAQYEKIAAGLDNVSYYGFTVQQVPRRIDAVEDVYSDKPYLLSSDSLELKNIVTQLRRSKNFRPLLHVGWRQAPKDRNKASAVKIFAGDNFEDFYQQQLNDYQTSVEASKEQEVLLSNIMQSSDDNAQINIEQLTHEQKQQQAISNLLAQLDNLPTDNEQLVNLIDSPKQALLTEDNVNDSLMLMQQPAEVPQPWYIDGLFKVHLNHYLYITADFNILNIDLAKYATESLKAERNTELKPIRFQQNRRVISGEIHYFDHPYMGMIVQIRRHKRPEPPAQEPIQEQTTTSD